jgi:hypothetical protein
MVLLALLVTGGALLVQSQETSEPLPSAAVEVGDPAGDGGDGDGGGGPARDRREDIGPGGSFHPPDSTKDLPQLTRPARPLGEKAPQFENPQYREIDDAEKAGAKLSKAADIIRDQIWNDQRLAQRAGTSPTPGRPQGRGTMEEKRIRMDRWVLNFETRDGGHDYARQLDALGAIVAVPQPDGRYLVIRDLKQRPAQGKIEEIPIQRVFWVDNKPESVRSLAQALQLERVPPWIAAFFPEEFEQELLRKERAFKNRREEDIRRTYFQVERKGPGYAPVVVRQELRTGVK